MPERSCSGALALVLASGGIVLRRAQLFTFTLADGVTVYRWAAWDKDLTIGGHTFSARKQNLQRTKWNVVNTMQVPELTLTLLSLNDAFDGGADIKTQIRNGLFRKASFLLQDLYMPPQDDPLAPPDTTTLGTMDIFGGTVAGATIEGAKATITVRGLANQLDQYAPKNIYQTGCLHAFCDAGCTLSRAAFTDSFAVGASPTAIFIPWASAPGDPSLYLDGEITFTSGEAAGQSRDIAHADSSGLTLEYPLYDLPSAADTFDAFQGCDYTKDSGSGRSCNDRSNEQNFFAFPFLPPPTSSY